MLTKALPDPEKLIRNELKTLEILKDQNHYPILKILKKEPMTVKELENAYEEETSKRKSNKTIYRYLKTLEDANLVIPAGQLVITGKTATETIYARSAMALAEEANSLASRAISLASRTERLASSRAASSFARSRSLSHARAIFFF